MDVLSSREIALIVVVGIALPLIVSNKIRPDLVALLVLLALGLIGALFVLGPSSFVLIAGRDSMKRQLFWGAGLAMLAGAAALAFRPARLLAATVTSVTPGSPPMASIAFVYGPGLAPASVIIDVVDRDGNSSSATIAGTQLFLELPLSHVLSGDHHITTTATYLLLGMPLTVVREFAASPAMQIADR